MKVPKLTLKTTALIVIFPPCRYSTILSTTEWMKLLKPFAHNSKMQATLTLLPNKVFKPYNTQTQKTLILLRKAKELNRKMSKDQVLGGNDIYHGPNLDLEAERGITHTRNIRNINLINTLALVNTLALESIGKTETLYLVTHYSLLTLFC